MREINIAFARLAAIFHMFSNATIIVSCADPDSLINASGAGSLSCIHTGNSATIAVPDTALHPLNPTRLRSDHKTPG
jgi:hypothetical protein